MNLLYSVACLCFRCHITVVVLNAALLLQACKAFILQMVVGLFSHCNLKYFDILDIFATGLLMLYNLQYLLQMVIKLTFLLEMIH